MQRRQLAVAALALALAATTVPAQTVPPSTAAAVVATAQDIVDNFRHIIVLHDLAQPGRPRLFAQAGQYLFWRNRELAAQLVDALAPRRGMANEAAIAVLLDAFDARKDRRDVDRLALGGVINEVAARLPAGHPVEARLRAAATRLTHIRALYNRELTAALAERTQTAPQRPDWNLYVRLLHQQYPVSGILDELKAALAAEPPAAPLGPESERAKERALRDELVKRGFRFARWDGTGLNADPAR